MFDPMPVTWTIEPEGRFAILVPVDPSTIEEWHAAMLEILASPVAAPHLRMLVDRRQTEPITIAFVNHMAGFFSQRQQVLAGSCTAVVVTDDAAFGMARMVELKSQLDNPSAAIRVFRTYEDAVRWLTNQ
jgi:hypothetical protein